jgi:hypothetical protein
MEKTWVPGSAEVQVRGWTGAAPGRNEALGIPERVSGELRRMTLASETTLSMARNLEALGENLETLGRILQVLEQRL